MPEWIEKWWIQWVFGLITAALTAGYARLTSKLKKQKEAADQRAEQDAKELKALKDGMRSILRRQLINDCENALVQKYCPVDRKRTIDDMYRSFEALGKEEAIKQLKETVMGLPTMPSSGNRPPEHKDDVWCSGWKTPDCDGCENKLSCQKKYSK